MKTLNYKRSVNHLHTVFKDQNIAQEIHENGFTVKPFLREDEVKALKKLYDENHDIKQSGMFMSQFSLDIEYRKKINEEIKSITKRGFDEYFHCHKIPLNSFLAKAPGQESEVNVHQDPSFIDEQVYAPLQIWCAISNITMENGPLCLMRKSHTLFSPFRTPSITPPYENIQYTIRKYMEPQLLNPGEIIFFDPRTLHTSLPNLTDEVRLATQHLLFPKEAQLLAMYKDRDDPNSKVEIYGQSDDFFIVNPQFYVNIKNRPITGQFLRAEEYNFPDMTEEEFISFCETNNLPKLDLLPSYGEHISVMLGEPVSEQKPQPRKRSWRQLLFGK